jgi:holliday junction DNA helicase RuvA
MFAYLQGKFTHKTATVVHLDVHGVGYEVHISLHTFSAIQSLQEGKLFTYLQIKEDAHTLFGFFELAEKEMFIALLSVSGVGAATARMMLSSLQPRDIVVAIQTGNVTLLERVKGIGKKTAERLVLELKDKVGKQVDIITNNNNICVPSHNNLQQDALSALIALGISKNVAENALNQVIKNETEALSLELLIKKTLKAI